MDVNKPINFAFKNITTEQFALLADMYEEKETVELETQIRFGVDFDQKLIAVFTPLKFLQNSKPFLIIEVACHFAIPEESWNDLKIEEGKAVKVPKGFLTHLAVLTIGTARGVLHCKTENTPFNKFLIPPINVNDIVKEDAIFRVNKPI